MGAGIATLASLAFVACSATPILKIDHEMEAIDLASCAAGVAPCVRTGNVGTEEGILPGGKNEVLIEADASIDAPLAQPATEARFAYLALGLFNRATNTTLEVSIVGDDSTKVVIAPPKDFARLELDMREYAPKPGARLKIKCVTGSLDVAYAIGRWFDYGKCSASSSCHAGVKCSGGRCADSAGSSCSLDADCGGNGAKCKSDNGKCSNAPDHG